ncbi:MAG: acyltransferase family protein [Chlorobium sp.]
MRHSSPVEQIPVRLKYRPDIDGLRAVAVLSVLCFHTNIPYFSGGFVGVDVFFVISGFLITSIILHDIQSEKFSIVKFYERRIRRILPALFPVIIFVVVIGAYLLDHYAFKALGRSITATTLFTSNVLFSVEDGEYFDNLSTQKPLLHTWSLSVEEQFYIFFPWILVLINRFSKNRYLPWLMGIGIVSFITSLFVCYYFPKINFYFFPARAWELIAGAILALGLPSVQNRLVRETLSFSGILMIMSSVIFYNEKINFPGYSALLPVFGSVLLIYTGSEKTLLGRFLALKPMVFIGLISYSLYLWHWPLVSFYKYILFREFFWYDGLLVILLSFFMAVLSFTYIERPFRRVNPVISGKKALLTVAACLMIVFSATGFIIHLQNGMPYRYPEDDRFSMDMTTDPQWNHYSEEGLTSLDGINRSDWMPPFIGKPDTTPIFLLWGDSHANSLRMGLSEKSLQYGLSGYIFSGIGILGNPGDINVIKFIKTHPSIRTIILAPWWRDDSQLLGVIKTIKELRDLRCNIVLVTNVPVLKVQPNRFFVVNKRLRTNPDFKGILPVAHEYEELNNNFAIRFTDLVSNDPAISIVHPESLLFDSKGVAIMMVNDKMLYIDDNHLSTYGSLYLAPLFDPIFREMVVRK